MRSRFAPMLCVLFSIFSAGFLPGADSSYTLKEGETLFSVSKRSGVPIDILAVYNSITDASKLKIGAVIKVPGTYVVKKGDTLYGIARSFSIPVDELLKLNKLGRDVKIRPGDTILLPSDAVAPTDGAQVTAAGGPPVATGAAAVRPALDTSAAGPHAPGDFVWPHPGKYDVEKGKLWWLVFQGAAGDVVKSATAGEVKWAATWVGFGKVLIVEGSDGMRYQYRGNRELLVNVGDRVQPGTEIAKLGPSLLGGGTKLYFSINDAIGNPIDPEKYFSAKSQS